MDDATQAALDSLKQAVAGAQPTEQKVEEVAEETLQEQVNKLQTKVQQILAEHNNEESNIPHAHEYWKVMNQFRALLRKL